MASALAVGAAAALSGVVADLGAPLLLGLWVAGLVAVALTWPRVTTLALPLVVSFHLLAVTTLTHRTGADLRGFTLWKEVLLLALAGSVLLRGGWSRRWDRIDVLSAALAAWAVARTVVAIGSQGLTSGIAARGLATDLSPVLLFVLARRLEWSAAWRERFTLAVIAVFAFSAVVGFVQLLAIGPEWYAAVGYSGSRSFQVPGLSIHRLSGVSLDPLVAGYCSAVGACLALDRMARARRVALPGWVCISALLAVATVASFTRAAWIGLVLAFAMLVWLGAGSARRRLVGVALLAGLPLLPLLPAIAHRVAATLRVSDTSTPLHLERWATGVQMLLEHPWGLGAGRAGEVSARMLGHASIVTESTYLQFGVEFGWVGMGLFTAWVAVIAWRLFGRARVGAPGSAGVLAAWIVMAVAALFQHALTERAPVFAVVVLAAIVLAERDGSAPT